jgi:dienelactone hydrolase
MLVIMSIGFGSLSEKKGNCFASSGIPQSDASFKKVEFESLDKLLVTADLYEAGDRRKPVIVLMHQSGSSRGEYRQIAPGLVRQGFNCLAVDLRIGRQDRWNKIENETAKRNGTAEKMARSERGEGPRPRGAEAVVDAQAAIKWLRAQGYTGTLVLWGSSFSANLAIRIATEIQSVAIVVAYSPGEYNKENPNEMKTTVKGLKQPIYIAGGFEEYDLTRPIYEAIPHENKISHISAKGHHGSSILLEDDSAWEPLRQFLKRYAH